ncbi:hypothetical protein [Deinococcus arcticus]|uniref:Uncharacterized protein n=1 Tax=Deinococcus arcticus TaxID=2136176 RepID=A0A2T3W8L2_9DEIO|nr:hypothetical protein [Deinococcus arcticus]PTA68240.1 hypothetical protein C8263_09310 [Deinococcus arcticus]
MPFQPLPQDQPHIILGCPDCHTSWVVYEQQIGLPVPCPGCGSAARPTRLGYTDAGSGRQVSFGSFRRLLEQPDTAQRVIPMVEHWLNVRHEGGLQFVDGAGQPVPLAEVHFRIQGHAQWQGELYNQYMNVAR